jgi:serine/threonine protein kinase
MDPERWQQIEDLCHSAATRAAAERAAFLDEACGDDRDLRHEVESLLAARSGAEGFLETPAVEHAELGPGTGLGHYAIEALIGEGGMGRVYRARDTKLGRQVALKVLPNSLASRSIDRERFDREARAVASLSHPNIVTLFSAEEDAGVHFLTMELVEGKPLSALLPRRGFPLGELLKLATPLADAVHAAHAKEIVHRDLKPANIMVTADGQLRVLDFGLAKLRAAVGEAGEATTQEATGEGRIVGTVAYMSPEQAEGKPLDHRTDIFSLGVVLYEMATGRRPFTGDTSASVMSSVIKDEPTSVRDVNPAVPAPLARVIKMCLRKDPDRRYQSAKDVRNELAAIHEESISGELEASVEVVRSGWRRWALPVVAAVAVVALSVSGYLVFRDVPAPPSPTVDQVTFGGNEWYASLSPDGEEVLYVSSSPREDGTTDIYRVDVGGGDSPRNLTEGLDGRHTQPDWSPDGQSIAFRSTAGEGGIWIMRRSGGSPIMVSGPELTSSAQGNGAFDPDWSPDGGRLVVAGTSPDLPTSVLPSPLWIVDIETRETKRLPVEQGFHPAWSPDGEFIAYWHTLNVWVVRADGSESPVQVTDVDEPDSAKADWRPTWSPDSRFLYYASERGGSMNLWRIPVDPHTGGPDGDPQPLIVPVSYLDRISTSRDGTKLALSFRNPSRDVYRIEFDAVRNEVVGDPEPVLTGDHQYTWLDMSPDRGRLALATGRIGQEDIYVSNVDGTDLRNLTDDRHHDRRPSWSPDGRAIVFSSNRASPGESKWEIHAVDVETGRDDQLTWSRDAGLGSAFAPSWSPKGDLLVYSNGDTADGTEHADSMFAIDPRLPWSDQTPEKLPKAPMRLPNWYFAVPSWSPQGRRLAGVGLGLPGVTIYDFDTREYRNVFGQVPRLGTAAWLDDTRILWAQGRTLYLVDLVTDSYTPIYVVEKDQRIISPKPGLDDEYIYFILRTEKSTIWIADLEDGR